MGNSSLEGKSARDLFPEIFARPKQKQKKDETAKVPLPVKKKIPKKSNFALKSGALPPPPPDTSWLPSGLIPRRGFGKTLAKRALIILPTGRVQTAAVGTLRAMGYDVDTATSSRQAVVMVQKRAYLVVIGHESMVHHGFHEHMRWLPPQQRRVTYYALVGPGYSTLYDLQALTLSVNLVIAEDDIEHLRNILRKGFRDFEDLYQPLLRELQIELPPLR